MMKKLLKNSLIVAALFAASIGFSQTVSNITLVSTGSTGSVTTSDPAHQSTIQVEAGGTLEATFTVSTVPANMEPVERTFSVVKYTTAATNVFNADNSNQFTYAADTYSETFTRTFNVPAEGNAWPGNSGTNVIIGETHKLILNGKRWNTPTTSQWGTSTDIFLEIVSPATLSTNAVEKNKPILYVSQGQLKVNKAADYEIYSITGALVAEGKASKTIDINYLSSGLYIYRTIEGTAKFVK